MDSVKLWGVVLPRMTNMLGKVAQTLRVDGTDRPRVKRLEWYPDTGMVLVELESKPEMPTVILLPRDQVSAIIPLESKSKSKEATKAKLPDESVSSSKLREQALEDLKAQGGKPPQGRTQEASFKVEGRGILEAADNITHKYDKKPKPKKRGRPKKKKG